MRTSETVAEISKAMAAAQSVMKAAHKDSTNPHFNSKYADLSAVWDSIREPLTANGISVFQDVENHGQGVSVTTRLQHASGEFFEFGPLVVPMAKSDAHGVGSAATYGRRFALSAAVGVVADADDDGNSATEPKATPERRQRPAAPPPAPAPAPAAAAPAGPVITDDQGDKILSAAKAVGIKTLGPLKAALQKFAGTDDVKRVPADKYEHVMEQLALMKAPAMPTPLPPAVGFGAPQEPPDPFADRDEEARA